MTWHGRPSIRLAAKNWRVVMSLISLRFWGGATCWVALQFIGFAQAASVLPDSGDALRSIEQRPRPELSPGGSEPLLPAQPLPNVQGGAADVRVPVRHFLVEGNTRLSDADIRQVLQPYEQRELTFVELQQAAVEVTRLYRARGYLLAQAYLPPQDVVD